jgi:transcriptional regulator with XRE-family HTH domain
MGYFFIFEIQDFYPNGFIFEPLEKLIFIMEQKIHQERNVKRFREMLGIKQEALAFDLGNDWNQKKISMLEQKDVIEDDILDQISNALKIPVEAFQNFDEEQAVNIISNTFDNGAFLNTGHSATFNVNPIEKLIQLHEEKIALYERMLREKDEMMARLEKLIDK